MGSLSEKGWPKARTAHHLLEEIHFARFGLLLINPNLIQACYKMPLSGPECSLCTDTIVAQIHLWLPNFS